MEAHRIDSSDITKYVRHGGILNYELGDIFFVTCKTILTH